MHSYCQVLGLPRGTCTDPGDPTADGGVGVGVSERGGRRNTNASPLAPDPGPAVTSPPDARVRAASSAGVTSKGSHENADIMSRAEDEVARPAHAGATATHLSEAPGFKLPDPPPRSSVREKDWKRPHLLQSPVIGSPFLCGWTVRDWSLDWGCFPFLLS